MALKINKECFNCDVCEDACPNQAISMGKDIYEINPDLCTECVGHFDEPQCQLLCPIECIEKDAKYSENNEQLLAKLRKIQEQKNK